MKRFSEVYNVLKVIYSFDSLRDEMEKWEKLLEDGKQAVEEAKV